jgi:hypothetical protein
MKFDFSGAELFLAFWAGQASLQQVLDHPAYQIVFKHAQRFSSGMSGQDVEAAIHEKPTLFYGLEGLSGNLMRIRKLIKMIRKNETPWIAMVHDALSELFPIEDTNMTIYPIIGYDMGIGLNDVVCMNCNCESYLVEPCEFLFYIFHECVHVIYERHHRVQPLSEVVTLAQWRSYFNLWTQNEGYAVYAPLQLRRELGYLAEHDYRVLFDPKQLEAHREVFLETFASFQQDRPLSSDAYLESCFGSMRLTYRIGCELIRRIESEYGMEAVREAFYLDGDRFMARYKCLIT